MRERAIETLLKVEVQKLGGQCLKWNCPTAGAPDRIVILPYKVYFVELKSPRGRLSLLQVDFHEKLKCLGFSVVVLKNKEQVLTWVKHA